MKSLLLTIGLTLVIAVPRQKETLQVDRAYTQNRDGEVPRVKDALLFNISQQKSVILVVWDPDRNCERGCCEFAYSLFEIGSEGRLHLLGENFYGCDV